ncbi:hypothetical protein AgCh_024382 [Apium graveolens]
MSGRNIQCPCFKCENHKFWNAETVKLYLLKKGFIRDYYVWDRHGEPYVARQRGEESSTHYSNTQGGKDDDNLMYNMVMDAAGPSFDPEIPNAEAQRLYTSPTTATHMRWHAEHDKEEGVIRHCSDSEEWKQFDRAHPSFLSETRNVRLGLSADRFQPFGATVGVETWDNSLKQNFRMRAALIWTVSDFPAYSMLSGWKTAGHLACPHCAHGHDAYNISHGGKTTWFDNHRKFLPTNHPFQKNKNWFTKGKTVTESAPPVRTGEDVLQEIESLGLKKITELGCDEHNARIIKAYNCGWKKRSIFWDLPYWRILSIRHNLDVMHVEKNVFENIFNTIMVIEGKTKDNSKARDDIAMIYRIPQHIFFFSFSIKSKEANEFGRTSRRIPAQSAENVPQKSGQHNSTQSVKRVKRISAKYGNRRPQKSGHHNSTLGQGIPQSEHCYTKQKNKEVLEFGSPTRSRAAQSQQESLVQSRHTTTYSEPSTPDLSQQSQHLTTQSRQLTPNIVNVSSAAENDFAYWSIGSTHMDGRIRVAVVDNVLEPSNQCSSQIRKTLYERLEPTGYNWKSVSKETKYFYFEEFKLDTTLYRGWLGSARRKYSKICSVARAGWETDEEDDIRIGQQVYEKWIENWQIPEFQKKSMTQKKTFLQLCELHEKAEDPIDKNAIFLEAVGGVDRKKRVYGVGSSQSLFYKSKNHIPYSSTSDDAENQKLQEEIKGMKEKMK